MVMYILVVATMLISRLISKKSIANRKWSQSDFIIPMNVDATDGEADW